MDFLPIKVTAEYIMRNAGLEEAQAGINDTTLMAESEEELKSLLMRVKKQSEKAGMELNMKKSKMIRPLAPSLHANRWGKSGNRDRFYLFGLQNYCRVTAAMKLKDACSLEGKL